MTSLDFFLGARRILWYSGIEVKKMYYTYVLRCQDNSLYTGIARDVPARMREHKEKDPKGAKYTRSRGFLRLEAVWECPDRSCASRLEWAIKRLRKEKKEKMVGREESFENLFPSLDAEKYRYRSPEEFGEF